MRSPLDDVWARLNREVLARLGPERYDAWIRAARPARLDEDAFVFHVEDAYVRDKVETLFRPAVTESARRVTNRKVRVVLAVEPASFAASAASALRDEPPPAAVRLPERLFRTFIPGRGNRPALAAALAFAGGAPEAGRTLLLHAPPGLGKTHLLDAIAAELGRRGTVGVLRFAGRQFLRQFDYASGARRVEAFVNKCRSARVLLFDDLHLLEGRHEAQSALLEIVLALEERGGRAAMTSHGRARALDTLAPPVRRRLRMRTEAAIEPPDAATGAAFLRACAPPGVGAAALDLIASAVRTNHKDQIHCLARLLERGHPTEAAAREVVREFLSRWGPGLTCGDIARAAARRFGVSMGDLYSPRRTRAASDARRACYYLARRLLREPFARIGEHFGGRDHATVLEACRDVERRNGAALVGIRRLEADLYRWPTRHLLA